jgi:hypothetical protein
MKRIAWVRFFIVFILAPIPAQGQPNLDEIIRSTHDNFHQISTLSEEGFESVIRNPDGRKVLINSLLSQSNNDEEKLKAISRREKTPLSSNMAFRYYKAQNRYRSERMDIENTQDFPSGPLDLITTFNGKNQKTYSSIIGRGSVGISRENDARVAGVNSPISYYQQYIDDFVGNLSEAERLTPATNGRITFDAPRLDIGSGSNGYMYKRRSIELSPEYGYLISSIVDQLVTVDEKGNSRTVDLMRFDAKFSQKKGIVYPEEICETTNTREPVPEDLSGKEHVKELTDWRIHSAGVIPVTSRTLNSKNTLINEPIDDAVFDFDFPAGTQVLDTVVGEVIAKKVDYSQFVADATNNLKTARNTAQDSETSQKTITTTIKLKPEQIQVVNLLNAKYILFGGGIFFILATLFLIYRRQSSNRKPKE